MPSSARTVDICSGANLVVVAIWGFLGRVEVDVATAVVVELSIQVCSRICVWGGDFVCACVRLCWCGGVIMVIQTPENAWLALEQARCDMTQAKQVLEMMDMNDPMVRKLVERIKQSDLELMTAEKRVMQTKEKLKTVAMIPSRTKESINTSSGEKEREKRKRGDLAERSDTKATMSVVSDD